MRRKSVLLCLLAIMTVAAIAISPARVAAGGWNHDYSDASNDVSYANIDITRIKSTSSGSDVDLEMTVRGTIETSPTVIYWLYIGDQTSGAGMYYTNGQGFIYYYGGSGFDTVNVTVQGNTLSGSIPKSEAGSESSFDVMGYAVQSTQTGYRVDWAGSAFTGDGGTTTDAGTLFGMAVGLFLMAIILPIIILIVIVVVLVLVLKKKKAPVQQPPYPPPQQVPPLQQYPPQYPQQYPPQQGPPRPPGR